MARSGPHRTAQSDSKEMPKPETREDSRVSLFIDDFYLHHSFGPRLWRAWRIMGSKICND